MWWVIGLHLTVSCTLGIKDLNVEQCNMQCSHQTLLIPLVANEGMVPTLKSMSSIIDVDVIVSIIILVYYTRICRV